MTDLIWVTEFSDLFNNHSIRFQKEAMVQSTRVKLLCLKYSYFFATAAVPIVSRKCWLLSVKLWVEEQIDSSVPHLAAALMLSIQGRLYRQPTMGQQQSAACWHLQWPWSRLCCSVHRGSPLCSRGTLKLEVMLDEGWGLLILIFFLGVIVWFDITGLPGFSCFWILGRMQKAAGKKGGLFYIVFLKPMQKWHSDFLTFEKNSSMWLHLVNN